LGKHYCFPSLFLYCFNFPRRLFPLLEFKRLLFANLISIWTRYFSPVKQNISTPKIFSLAIALGSSGTLTFKFSPNFHLFISPIIQGVFKKLFGYTQIDIPSTKSYTATQKYHFRYGKINTSKEQLFSNINILNRTYCINQ